MESRAQAQGNTYHGHEVLCCGFGVVGLFVVQLLVNTTDVLVRPVLPIAHQHSLYMAKGEGKDEEKREAKKEKRKGEGRRKMRARREGRSKGTRE